MKRQASAADGERRKQSCEKAKQRKAYGINEMINGENLMA
jgi:hypothetical protein